MRYFFICLFAVYAFPIAGQNYMINTDYSSGSIYAGANEFGANKDFLDFTKGLKLISLNTCDANFQRTYLVNKNGETISTGHMPSRYFLPNDNFIVISGRRTNIQDSFNPYGANDMASAIILGTFNNFISRLKKHKR